MPGNVGRFVHNKPNFSDLLRQKVSRSGRLSSTLENK